MIKFLRPFLLIGFSIFFAVPLHAEAPVVEDSENFAIFEEPQNAIQQPIAKTQLAEANLNEELQPLAQDNHDSQEINIALLDKLQVVRQEIQELRGQLELQTHDLKLLREQLTLTKHSEIKQTEQDKPTTELSTFVNQKALETQPSKTQMTLSIPAFAEKRFSAATKNPADEQISYLAAYELVKNKRFDDAMTAMQNFITIYPRGGYTANAHYWLGELYLVKNDYPNAISQFEIVLHTFPKSSKAAASTLKLAYALAASGKEKEAKMQLLQVLKNYPDTTTAQLATAKLESLGVS